jgi:hypothetical protein
VVVLVYIPTSSVEGSFFPTSLPTNVIGGVFDDGYSNRGEVESQCGFDLHFPYQKPVFKNTCFGNFSAVVLQILLVFHSLLSSGRLRD